MADKSIDTPSTWNDEDNYWRRNYSSRPYGRGKYDTFRPAYQYGYEAANQYVDRDWDEVEEDLEKQWGDYGDRGTSTWQQVKDAVRDAWDRVRGRN